MTAPGRPRRSPPPTQHPGLWIALAVVVMIGTVVLAVVLASPAAPPTTGTATLPPAAPTATLPPLALATTTPVPSASLPTPTAEAAVPPTATATTIEVATATLPPSATAPPPPTVTLAPTATTPPTPTAPPPPTATAPPPPTVPPTAPPPPAQTPTPATMQQIDAYISTLTMTQQIGELLMMPVYADTYTADYDVYLQQDQIANAIMFTELDNGVLKPKTLAAFRALTQALVAHAPNPLIIATDEEGGLVDRLALYYGASPAPSDLGATGDPQKVYAQAQLDAKRMKENGINVDFAPLADIDQGGAIDSSRMFGTTPAQVAQFAGAFLDGLQQNGVRGTLKHWPGIGAANANPDFSLPTITKTKAQLNAYDFLTFRNLLAHDPGMIMVTHVMEPAYDTTYPASLSPTLIDGVLRDQLGYQGVVVSDAMAAGAIGQYMKGLGFSDPAKAVGEASVLAILAGEDIIECPNNSAQIAGTVDAITKAVQSGRISPARLKLSLERIIALKIQMGLITLPP